MIGIIYKLKCLETDEFYIGSTFNINERIDNHKRIIHSSSSSKKLIKRNNYYFIILEKKEFPNRTSLYLLENLYILIGWKTSKCINNNLAIRTKKIKKIVVDKYYQKNKDIISEKRKQKVKCKYCNAIVNRSGLKRHQNRNICLNNRLNL